jgi:hypothetical protein
VCSCVQLGTALTSPTVRGKLALKANTWVHRGSTNTRRGASHTSCALGSELVPVACLNSVVSGSGSTLRCGAVATEERPLS